MPSMLRLPGKGKKIAYAILGKPANMTGTSYRRPKRQIVTTTLLT